MKKKILIFFCSPNPHGNTRNILDRFLKKINSNEFEIIQINVYNENITSCTGCLHCATQESCTYRDLDRIDSLIRKSDLLVVASPVYNSSFPAPFKAILDRFQRYFEARFSLKIALPIKTRRSAILLLSQGSDDDFGIAVTTYQLRRSFSVMNTELIGCATDRNTDNHLIPADKEIDTLIRKLNTSNTFKHHIS